MESTLAIIYELIMTFRMDKLTEREKTDIGNTWMCSNLSQLLQRNHRFEVVCRKDSGKHLCWKPVERGKHYRHT